MVRPMTPDDAPAVLALMVRTFDDLMRRLGRESDDPGDPRPGLLRIRHLATSDPAGAWVAEEDGAVVGAALALVREGLWGLSLLVVDPALQSRGVGSELLRRSVDYGDGARGGIILSSEDARALRAYARAGFDVRPALDARGIVRRPPPRPEAVRPGRWPDDSAIVDRASRAVRGATHAVDVPVYLEGGRGLLVHEDGGFLVNSAGTVALIAAVNEDIAQDLLRAHLHAVGEDGKVEVDFLAAGQDWAVSVLLDAGVDLAPGGAIFTRGDVGPMAPYIPSGAYL